MRERRSAFRRIGGNFRISMGFMMVLIKHSEVKALSIDEDMIYRLDDVITTLLYVNKHFRLTKRK